MANYVEAAAKIASFKTSTLDTTGTSLDIIKNRIQGCLQVLEDVFFSRLPLKDLIVTFLVDGQPVFCPTPGIFEDTPITGGLWHLAKDEIFSDWCRREVRIEEQAANDTVSLRRLRKLKKVLT